MAIVKQHVKNITGLTPARKKKSGDVIENENFVESVSSTGTVDLGTDVELVDASGGVITRTLPTPDFEGQTMFIKKIDSSANAVTVDTEGSETIDGAATQSVASQWDKIKVVTDGTNWFIVNT